jgi:hypothetical protein
VSTAPEFDPARGRLLIAAPTLAVLVAHAADPVGAALGEAGARDELASVTAAGVIEGGRAHPAIAGALRAIVRPELCTLELSHSGSAMQGWVSYDAAALLLPPRAGDDRRVLLDVHPTMLPDALARLADLGPRPLPDADAPVPPERVEDVRRRWRLGAGWTLEDGRTGGDGLEVIDSAGGLWLVSPSAEDEQALAWPVSATFVWRQIVRLVMRRAAAPARS